MSIKVYSFLDSIRIAQPSKTYFFPPIVIELDEVDTLIDQLRDEKNKILVRRAEAGKPLTTESLNAMLDSLAKKGT